MLQDSSLLNAKPVKILPHIVDTVLLLSAFTLAYLIGQAPFADSWLTAKLLALVAYIVLGVFALRRGKTKVIRSAAFVAALLTFFYIVGVAFSRSATLGMA